MAEEASEIKCVLQASALRSTIKLVFSIFLFFERDFIMIDLKRTFYTWSDTQPLVIGEEVSEEGQGLVGVLEGGVEKVKPAVGEADEKVVGFAMFRQLDFSTAAVVEDHVIPTAAPYVVELGKNNLMAGQIRVEGASPDSVDLDNGTLTFLVGNKGKTIRVYYRYKLTVAEAKMTFYEAPTNMPDPNFFSQVGVGKGKGRLFTMFYDQAVDWTDAVPGLGAKGLISNVEPSSLITAIPNGRVVSIPTPTDPYLGIEFLV